MHSRLIRIVPAVLILAAFALGACQAATEEPAPETQATSAPLPEAPAPPPEAPAEKKVAVFIFTQEFDTLNPYYSSMFFSITTHQLWNVWAWQFDDGNSPYPVMLVEMPTVENGGVSADGTVLTMKLRDDLTWSDGEPLTAADFVFTYQMNVDPNNAVSSAYPYDTEVASVEAPDDRTVVVTFNQAFIPWAANLWKGVLPEHILGPVFEAEGTIDNAEWNTAPTVSAGPFVFAEWESGSFARFVANDNYWLGRPLLDEIFIRFVPDDASQINALVAGDGDLGTFFAYPDVPTLEEAGIEVITVQSGYNEGWFLYLGENAHPGMQDLRVRQALALGFDRAAINSDLLLGLTQPPSTYWENTPFADPSIEPWPYDPEQAAALLDEAGWVDSNGDGTRDKDGVELVLSYGTTTREIRQDTQAVAQQQLSEIGIGLELSNADADTFFASYGDGGLAATGQFDIMEWSDSTNFPDPDWYYWLCSEIPSDDYPDGQNWQAICDEQLDGWFQQQLAEADPEKRMQIFHQISRYIFEQVYWLGLWQDPDLWGISGRLTNVRLSGVTPFFSIAEWDLTP
jgi:peptide/nickel transport system substrate-binding protein